MRDTRDWADWELEILESYYSLEGGASVRARLAARGSRREEFSVRHKASRLDLAADMLEFTPAPEVARAAGVSPQAVHQWLDERNYRRHCRTLGRLVLVPAPAVRLYLHERRVSTRPRGWWGAARAAEVLGVHDSTLTDLARRGDLTAVLYRGTMFYDPHTVRDLAAARHHAPATAVQVNALAAVQGLTPEGARVALRRAGAPLKVYRQPGRAPANYTTADHARAFLSARGHREEQVETLLRRALQQSAKLSDCDREES